MRRGHAVASLEQFVGVVVGAEDGAGNITNGQVSVIVPVNKAFELAGFIGGLRSAEAHDAHSVQQLHQKHTALLHDLIGGSVGFDGF